jgi:predicted flap endonuclease-1-like 5' DNA nuclease
MGYLLTQMFLYMLGAFLLGLLLGWIIWSRRTQVDTSEADNLRVQLTQSGREREAMRGERDRLKTELDACASARRELEARIAQMRATPPPAPARVVEAPPPPAPAPEPVRFVETAPPPAPKPTVPDDLKRIRGIGRVNEAKLNEMGITTFAQIAAWGAAEEERYGELLEFEGRIEREEWVAQAKILASGRDTEFSERVDKGEVDTSK